jgi:hypothetical protein
MTDENAAPAPRIAAANALLDRGYGKPTQPAGHAETRVDARMFSDEELTAIILQAQEGSANGCDEE